MATSSPMVSALLCLLLLLSSPKSSDAVSYKELRTLFSLAHSLVTRVSNLRAARGDLEGSRRARIIADKLEKGIGLGFWKLLWSMGWDYVRNYAWRDTTTSFQVLSGVVYDANELLSSLSELTLLQSDADRAAWLGRNYKNVLRISNSLYGRLLTVFRKSGPLRDMVETLKLEMEGDFLRDCIEVGINDLKGDHMGLESYIQPFASIKPADMVKGVNYASGSAGILKETGNSVGQRIPLDDQLQHHQATINNLTEILGKDKVQAHLNKCLYSVYAGSNDYMLNYFQQKSTTVTPEKFTETLIPIYTEQIKKIYGFGARKVVVFGLSPLGCLPMSNTTGGCSSYINNVLGNMFNKKVKSLIDEFNKNLKGSQFIFVDSMRIIDPDLKNLGLLVKDTPCCGTGQIWCTAYSTPCMNRNDYVYWDDAHTTEAANRVLANRAYNAKDPEDAYPMDIRSLVTSNTTIHSTN